jgi:hypothetical protein
MRTDDARGSNQFGRACSTGRDPETPAADGRPGCASCPLVTAAHPGYLPVDGPMMADACSLAPACEALSGESAPHETPFRAGVV